MSRQFSALFIENNYDTSWQWKEGKWFGGIWHPCTNCLNNIESILNRLLQNEMYFSNCYSRNTLFNLLCNYLSPKTFMRQIPCEICPKPSNFHFNFN